MLTAHAIDALNEITLTETDISTDRYIGSLRIPPEIEQEAGDGRNQSEHDRVMIPRTCGGERGSVAKSDRRVWASR